jgi:hypothetical protein
MDKEQVSVLETILLASKLIHWEHYDWLKSNRTQEAELKLQLKKGRQK